jgi:hypothetical protein
MLILLQLNTETRESRNYRSIDNYISNISSNTRKEKFLLGIPNIIS